MNQIGKAIEFSLDRTEINNVKVFKWVAIAIALMLGCNAAQSSWSRFLYLFLHQEQASVDHWRASVDVRGLVFLLLTPLFAAIIVDWRQSLSRIILTHFGLFAIVVVISCLFLHEIEHYQSDLARKISAPEVEKTNNNQGGNADEAQKSNPIAKIKPRVCDGWRLPLFEVPRCIVTYLMTISVGYAVLYFNLRENRKRQTEQLRRALERLKRESLFSRLQPHFLFNTLNTISALTSRHPDSARKCITQLGQLLRHSIEVLPSKKIGLEEELDILRCYLEIQKMRYGDRLEYSITTSDNVHGIEVPAFVLQPLVENSFEHGFRGKSDLCRIEVDISLDSDFYCMKVIDNGRKFDAVPVVEERIGLGLTRQRLRLQYGNEASIGLEPNDPCGLIATVKIPVSLDSTNTIKGKSWM